MPKIDTHEWKEFIIGDLFDKLQLDITNKNFDKSIDVSERQTDEFSLPLVNAKHGNNGIMYYGRESDFETAEMSIDIVQNGAIATGDVYAQPQKTGVLWDAYLIKPKATIASQYTLLFLATVIERAIKQRFSYDNKCIWDKAKALPVRLPVTQNGKPDFAYMDAYMSNIMLKADAALRNSQKANLPKAFVDVSEWKEFVVGDLFKNIVKPPVLHTREVQEEKDGIPYVVRTKFNNGIKCRVTRTETMRPSPAGVITFGAENATFFYQKEEFVSGRDIYYIDTRALSKYACRFLVACLQPIARKYSYNYGLFPDLLKKEKIKLPVDEYGQPDWRFMEKYMLDILPQAERSLNSLQDAVQDLNGANRKFSG